jgi:hypothetical protein
MSRLTEMQLLRPIGDTRFGMHDLTRLFAIERAEVDLHPCDREPAIDRGLAHFVTTSAHLSTFLLPGREPVGSVFEPRDDVPMAPVDSAAAAVDWLDREMPGLVAVSEHVAAHAETLAADHALFPLYLSRALIWVLIKW